MHAGRWRSRAAVPIVAAVMMAASCGSDGSDGDVGLDDAAGPPTTTVDDLPGPPTTAGESTTTTPAGATRIEVTVRGGAVVGGAGRERVALDEPVVVVVDADVADEVHVHGYDLTAPVAPGAPAELQLSPDIPGVFEVELEARGLVLLRLEVA